MGAPYAIESDLAARWLGMPQDSATQATATVLLGDASFWLRQWFPNETALIDAGGDGTGAKILVCAMVKRAMLNADSAGVSSASQAMGPINESRSYSNPDGNLYILWSEEPLIKGGGRMRSVRMSGGSEAVCGTHRSGIDQPGPSLWPDADVWELSPKL